ncbi:hypothetical protein [Streptomyces sp. NPDC093094]|uniref:hypothetical protein n=1 Tax=Streptomyces sp. NPDC093094 TaxID=3366026 RepID=UPI0037F48071
MRGRVWSGCCTAVLGGRSAAAGASGGGLRLGGGLGGVGGLVWLVFGLARTGRPHLAPLLVASCIGAAYWFTSSTSFANPAVTIGRTFTDTFAGIAPASLPPFLAAQLVGAATGLALAAVCFGRPAAVNEDDTAVPHGGQQPVTPPRPTEEGVPTR